MRNRFEAIADRWLKVVLRGNPEFMCECPFCEGRTSLQFNVSKGLWVCFRCDERGSAKSLVKKLGGSYSNPVIELDELEDRLAELEAPQRSSETRILPESTLARYRGRAHEYWTDKRRFSEETIRFYQLGYDPISDRCTIPFRNPDGDLLGVIYRRLDDQFPRYNYPKEFDRKGSLFGSWNFRGGDSGDHAVLVEGSTDTMWVHQAGHPSLGQYGSSLHPNQLKLIHRLGISDVTLFYDYDAAGLKAFKQAPTVLQGVTIRRVFYDGTRYCWHDRICGCSENHNPLNIGEFAKCQRKVRCLCGRKHCPDPGSLSKKEVRKMLADAQLIGKEAPWNPLTSRRRSGSRKRARSNSAEGRPSRGSWSGTAGSGSTSARNTGTQR